MNQGRATETTLIRVWDPAVRLFHWSLVLTFAVAWLSANAWEDLHTWAGFAAAGLIALRLVWGVIGTPYARFRQFVRPPKETVVYLKAIAAAKEARCVGHNPAGGAMIIALILAMSATALTGWLLTTDAFWGVRWMQKLHERSADGIMLLVVVHVAGVVLASFRHRENLIRGMISGMKRGPGPGDVA